jgi:hypothetical protein
MATQCLLPATGLGFGREFHTQDRQEQSRWGLQQVSGDRDLPLRSARERSVPIWGERHAAPSAVESKALWLTWVEGGGRQCP